MDVTMEGLPLFVFEEDRAGQVGRLASQHGQMVDALGDNYVDAEAGLQSICGSQLTVFDPAAAFQCAMKNLDALPFSIPVHTLFSVFHISDRICGQ